MRTIFPAPLFDLRQMFQCQPTFLLLMFFSERVISTPGDSSWVGNLLDSITCLVWGWVDHDGTPLRLPWRSHSESLSHPGHFCAQFSHPTLRSSSKEKWVPLRAPLCYSPRTTQHPVAEATYLFYSDLVPVFVWTIFTSVLENMRALLGWLVVVQGKSS